MDLTKGVSFKEVFSNINKNRKLLFVLAFQLPVMYLIGSYLYDNHILSDSGLKGAVQAYALGLGFLVWNIVTGKYPKQK